MRATIHRKIPGRRGFTLIELMVVIVLIAIMTAMILPEMRGTFEEALLRSEARKLADVFSLANSRAIALNQAQRVQLDSQHHFMIEPASSAVGGSGGSRRAPEVPGGEGTIDPRIAAGTEFDGLYKLVLHRGWRISHRILERGCCRIYRTQISDAVCRWDGRTGVKRRPHSRRSIGMCPQVHVVDLR